MCNLSRPLSLLTAKCQEKRDLPEQGTRVHVDSLYVVGPMGAVFHPKGKVLRAMTGYLIYYEGRITPYDTGVVSGERMFCFGLLFCFYG